MHRVGGGAAGASGCAPPKRAILKKHMEKLMKSKNPAPWLGHSYCPGVWGAKNAKYLKISLKAIGFHQIYTKSCARLLLRSPLTA